MKTRSILLFLLVGFSLFSCRKDPGNLTQYCGQLVESSYPNYESDPFTIRDAFMTGDFLTLSMNYSGGCEEHCFQVIWGGDIGIFIYLVITHDANGDGCEAFVQDDFDVDLYRIKSTVQNFDQNIDAVEIQIQGYFPLTPIIYYF